MCHNSDVCLICNYTGTFVHNIHTQFVMVEIKFVKKIMIIMHVRQVHNHEVALTGYSVK